MKYHWGHQALMLQEMKRWISNCQKNKKPFFIFINYLDAHTPYNPPEPFKGKFEKTDHGNPDLQKIINVLNFRHGFPFINQEYQISEDEWNVAKSWYDAEIAFIDFFMGKLFDYMKKRGLYEDTCILITSDHGENFGEHQLANHVFCLYDTLIHVPLVIRCPENNSAGKRISNIISHVDIFPTLLDVLNIDTELGSEISGVSLFPFTDKIYHKYVFAEYGPPLADINALKSLCPNIDKRTITQHNKSLKCVRSREFKYIMKSDGSRELYHLEKDPNEKENRVAEFPEKNKELKSILQERLIGHFRKEKVPTFDEKIRRSLEELGYFQK